MPEEPEEPSDPVEEEIPFIINITPKGEGESVNIKIVRLQDGQSQTVYNEVHAVNEEVQIYLSGKASSVFEFYQDNSLIEVIEHPGR